MCFQVSMRPLSKPWGSQNELRIGLKEMLARRIDAENECSVIAEKID